MNKEQAIKMGATHCTLNPTGEFIQLYYKQEEIKINDGTIQKVWLYLSSFDIWITSISQNSLNPQNILVSLFERTNTKCGS